MQVRPGNWRGWGEGAGGKGCYACCVLVQLGHGVWVCDLRRWSLCGDQMSVISSFVREDVGFTRVLFLMEDSSFRGAIDWKDPLLLVIFISLHNT